MSNFNPRDIAKFPGKLCVDPTDLSAAYPHGGTGLGVVRNIIFTPENRYTNVVAEEYGGEVVEGVYLSQSCILAATLQSWDSEALRAMFLNTEDGAISGRRKVKEPGSIRSGSKLSDKSKVLLFSPNDTDKAPMLLIRRAIPQPPESMAAAMSLASDIAVPLGWRGIRDSSGRLYEWAMRKDITL